MSTDLPAGCGACLDYADDRRSVLVPAIIETAERHLIEPDDLLVRYANAIHERHCWCGKFHDEGFWHDPTHGNVDRDIQELVAANFPGAGRAQAYAIMLTAQGRRDRGESI